MNLTEVYENGEFTSDFNHEKTYPFRFNLYIRSSGWLLIGADTLQNFTQAANQVKVLIELGLATQVTGCDA